ncbi:MAG TPA: NADH-quinone oxidoreductase subunit NuoB [Candidatus Bathyarchaeota archaeon]|nr:NADH-quinone oxidoreductase subunit NuoB [Candidatus Bathyarchaeota archaeon]
MGLLRWARAVSPWILHFNTGACNACDIEVVAALTPRFDVERFGALKVGSPRHADILVVTGPVTRESEPRLRRLYEQMPEPKLVMAVGTCAISGGVFAGCYNVRGGVINVLGKADMMVPGCPPRPEAILEGLIKLVERLRGIKKR